DFTWIYRTLGLDHRGAPALLQPGEWHADAQHIHGQYASQPMMVDFSHYRSVQAIVDKVEKLFQDFKRVAYDVNTHIKAFETKVVGGKAQEMAEKIDVELQTTLANIEEARPFDDLSCDDVGKAHPWIVEGVETTVKKGKWMLRHEMVTMVAHVQTHVTASLAREKVRTET
ncbi:ATP synthase d subunit, partial [Pisolithus albus]